MIMELNNSIMVKQRIEWIDLAKGFCMLLVILGHYPTLANCMGIQEQCEVMTYFRMPFYFILSGLFFKTYGNLSFFIKKKINHLLIPYVVFMPMHFVLYPFQFDSVWFLYCLFIVNIIGFILFMIMGKLNNLLPPLLKKDKSSETVISILSFVFSLILALPCYHYSISHFLVRNPNLIILQDHIRWIESAFIATPFFVFGYYLRNCTTFLTSSISWRRVAVFIIIAIITIIGVGYVYDWGYVSFFSDTYKIPFLMIYVVGVISSFSLLMIAKKIKHLPVISYIGRYSIVVLITHKAVLLLVQKVIYKIAIIFEFNAQSIYAVLIVFILTVLVEIPIIKFSIKYLPYLFAQKELLK